MIDDIAMRVSIIFFNRYAQVTYGARVAVRAPPLAQRLNYETLWVMNTGSEYLTEENAAWSIDLLDQLLLILAGLLQQIVAQPIPL
jgi:hypothetical protein